MSSEKLTPLAFTVPVGANDACPVDDLEQLHRTMSVRLARLEALIEELDHSGLRILIGSAFRDALALRDLLLRAAGTRAQLPEVVPSFEELLWEAIRWAYFWTIQQLESLRVMPSREAAASATPSVPPPAQTSFRDLAALCKADNRGDASRAFVKTLVDLDDALYRFTRTRDRIARLVENRLTEADETA
jgi:hypothetical protein